MKYTKPNSKTLIVCMVITLVGLTMIVSGCGRERSSEATPVHLVDNMDNQPRYEAQGPSAFFDDHMAMRQPVEGTIARGQLIEDPVYNTGLDLNGDTLVVSPVPISFNLLVRGQDRFDIYCAPCHGRVGDGKGTVSLRGMLPPPTFHSDSLRGRTDGHMFDVITNGKGNMPSYSFQVRVDDRWAIVAYVRALQRSQYASDADMPPDTTQPVAPVTDEKPAE